MGKVIRSFFMSKLSPEQEQHIVRALTDPNLDWMPDLFGTSHQIISDSEHCSMEQARSILESIYVERKLIEAVSKSGGTHPAHEPLNSTWKWIKKRK